MVLPPETEGVEEQVWKHEHVLSSKSIVETKYRSDESRHKFAQALLSGVGSSRASKGPGPSHIVSVTGETTGRNGVIS